MNRLEAGSKLFKTVMELGGYYKYLLNESEPKMLRRVRASMLYDNIYKTIEKNMADYLLDYELLLSYIDTFEHCKSVCIDDIDDIVVNINFKDNLKIDMELEDNEIKYVYTLSLENPSTKEISYIIKTYENGNENATISIGTYINIISAASINSLDVTDSELIDMEIHTKNIKDILIISLLELIKE